MVRAIKSVFIRCMLLKLTCTPFWTLTGLNSNVEGAGKMFWGCFPFTEIQDYCLLPAFTKLGQISRHFFACRNQIASLSIAQVCLLSDIWQLLLPIKIELVVCGDSQG